jgi:NADPH-dependent 7-cyano-7-deazaguanine reductase QueF-like protein
VPGVNYIAGVPCIQCGGKSGNDKCGQCSGTGELEIKECPLKIITADIWETLELADFWEKGLPPIGGGVLDQTQNFVEAARFVFSEKNYWKRKLGID